MGLSINNNNSVSNILNSSQNGIAANNNAGIENTFQASSDSVDIPKTQSVNSNPYGLPEEAGKWKRFTNAVGTMFSNIADSMGFGETRDLLDQEFFQIDLNKNQGLDLMEFNIGTLNLLDIFGTEFARADKNGDGMVAEREYYQYRKDQLGRAFDMRDQNMDRHLTINEFGYIGQQMMINRDPRLDENLDGVVNKREFTRASLRGMLNLREWLNPGI